MKKNMAKIFGLHELFLPSFLAFPKSKRIIKETAVKHALVNSSKESIIESRIMRLS